MSIPSMTESLSPVVIRKARLSNAIGDRAGSIAGRFMDVANQDRKSVATQMAGPQFVAVKCGPKDANRLGFDRGNICSKLR